MATLELEDRDPSLVEERRLEVSLRKSIEDAEALLDAHAGDSEESCDCSCCIEAQGVRWAMQVAQSFFDCNLPPIETVSPDAVLEAI
jgi:hypothetical protein